MVVVWLAGLDGGLAGWLGWWSGFWSTTVANATAGDLLPT